MWLGRFSMAVFAACLASGVGACQSKNETAAEKKLAELKLTPQEAKRILAELSTKRVEHEAPAPVARRVPEPLPDVSTHRAPTPTRSWIIDELEDIAPAAPSTATPSGVFLVNGGNELFLAKLGPMPKSRTPSASPVGVVPDAKGPFPLGRGPVFTQEYAYWITSHFLLRRPTRPPYGPLEIVQRDARVGTRAAAVVSSSGNAAIAYIALPAVKNGPLRAKLWLEGRPFETASDLTDSGNSTLSVALAGRGARATVFALEARMGVTALHTRSMDVSTGQLGPDEVPWIGGTAQPFTEVRARDTHPGWTALLAMEQDSSHFGLVLLSKTTDEKTLNERWLTFPNGLDPAPVSTAQLCGRDAVLFARPSEPTPKAPQELVLATIVGDRFTDSTVLSSARSFYDVSLSEAKGGGLVSFVADERTWARTLRCGAPNPVPAPSTGNGP